MKIKIYSLIRNHYLIISFLLFYFLIIGYKLIFHPLPFYDWDEAIYAQVGREMITNKSLIPLWQGNYWLDKPPLVLIIYGLINKFLSFTAPEIIDRVFNLFLIIIAYILIYTSYLKVVKDKLLSSLTVVLSSLTPLFLQRAHQINFDVFLLVGWLGYLLFFDNFLISLFFLSLSVLSKSLIGFYPPILFFFYYLFIFLLKKIDENTYKKMIQKIALHIVILSIWYLLMFVIFDQKFWQQHIIESHFRRVTASIESHFGKRTFYIDLLFEQFSSYIWLSLFGCLYFIHQFQKKKLNHNQFFYGLYLLPWFIFLNLTKTKIFWYIYPSIPLFAFLTAYLLNLFKDKRILAYSLFILISVSMLKEAIVKHNLLNAQYSSFSDYYNLANEAKNRCQKLYYLVDTNSRQAMATLEKMGLTITTTKWWGNHPSVVYYFGKQVNFIYNKEKFISIVSKLKNDSCLAIENEDLTTDFPASYFQKIRQFNSLDLFKKI
jgi:4-amino-4-deoxy-L-arabinose transferase-like glycosyltransferase